MSTPAGTYFASTGMENASPDIHFRIASNTKTFTAASIMLLHQRGLLDIDDVITANIPGMKTLYVPDSASYAIPYKDGITIRQLLSHMAGVFDVTNESIPLMPRARTRGRATYRPRTCRGSSRSTSWWAWSPCCRASCWPPSRNSTTQQHGILLLGKVIERVSGLSYSEFVVITWLVPNRLTETSSPSLFTETTLPAPFAVGYSLDYLGSMKLVATIADNMSINVAEGNMISTPAQLAQWNRALVTGAAGLDDTTVDLMKCAVPVGRRTATASGSNGCRGSASVTPGPTTGTCRSCCMTRSSDVSMVLFFSLINFDDVGSEGKVLFDVGTQARAIVGRIETPHPGWGVFRRGDRDSYSALWVLLPISKLRGFERHSSLRKGDTK